MLSAGTVFVARAAVASFAVAGSLGELDLVEEDEEEEQDG